jgi:hypothetical protein
MKKKSKGGLPRTRQTKPWQDKQHIKELHDTSMHHDKVHYDQHQINNKKLELKGHFKQRVWPLTDERHKGPKI